MPQTEFRRISNENGDIIPATNICTIGIRLTALNRYRSRRMQMFLMHFKPGLDTKILDVGGSSAIWLGTGLNRNVTLLNLTKPKQRDLDLGFHCIQADALNMEAIRDQSFDIAFSNSVIEHVGGYAEQKRFAEEVRRVSKSYWVQTPNRTFPFEPHLMFPFAQFLPTFIKRRVAFHWPYSNYRRWGIERKRVIQFLDQTRLMTEEELKSLFPKAAIYKERFLGMNKSLIACKKT